MTAAAAAPDLKRAALKRAATLLAGATALGAALFLSAGTIAWRRGWLYLGLYLGLLAVTAILLRRYNPELMVHRGTRHEGTKRFDKIISPAYSIVALGLAAVAGLDAVRFGWAPLDDAAVYPGLVLFILSYVPIVWAMMVNPFLETTVRIQTERNHRVIAAGPYAFVRHPMYVGILLQTISVPLLLGSAWAFAPAGLMVGIFVLRTALEDRTLRAELEGYEEYAHLTRYRLVPGIW